MVPRDLHLGNEEFSQLKVGETIRVEIQKSRFQLRDPFIVSVAVYRGRAGALPPTKVIQTVQPTQPVQPVQPIAEAPEEAEESEAEESEAEESEAEEGSAESKEEE
jgi:hypothetical protein